MKCYKVRKYLALNFGDDLTTAIPPEIGNHLNDCSACAAYFEFMKSSFLAVENQNKTKELPPYFYSRLVQKMENRNGLQSYRISTQSFQTILATLIIVVAITLGFFVGNSNSILYSANNSNVEIAKDEYLNYIQADLFEEQYLNIINDEQ